MSSQLESINESVADSKALEKMEFVEAVDGISPIPPDRSVVFSRDISVGPPGVVQDIDLGQQGSPGVVAEQLPPGELRYEVASPAPPLGAVSASAEDDAEDEDDRIVRALSDRNVTL